MKKILSLTLAVLMVVSMIPTAFAAETQDYSLGTAVTVEGAGGEYTVTVPATLNAGQVGTVTAKGYWAAEDTLKVTAPETIEVTNTATSQKTTVNVTFAGIESLGDDLEEMNIPVDISIDAGNTKFGTWTGTIVYNVEMIQPPAGQISFVIQDDLGTRTTLYAEEGMTWSEWIASDYNTCQAIEWQGVHWSEDDGGRGRNLFYTDEATDFESQDKVGLTDIITAGTTYYRNMPA